jgi:hypothetical protein
MQRVIIAIVAVAALGLVWMLMSPASAPPAATAPGATAETAAPARVGAGAEAAAPAAAAQAVVAQGAVTSAAPSAAFAADARPGAAVGQDTPSGERKWGRSPQQGIANLTAASLKGTVRRFFGNLPKSGQVPGRVEVQEVLPPELVQGLNVPPESELLWLGERPITDVKAFETVLAFPDDVRRMIGVTVRTPDGKELRDYVELRP